MRTEQKHLASRIVFSLTGITFAHMNGPLNTKGVVFSRKSVVLPCIHPPRSREVYMDRRIEGQPFATTYLQISE
jgi:hypothetical protein